MIQELKVKNFLSFRDEAVLSFEATRDTSLEDRYVVEVAPGVRLLRFAMIMGANASGKSNLLYALDFVRQWWFERPDNNEEPTGVMPFMLDSSSCNEPSEIELRFWTGGIRYHYLLRATTKQVIQERLSVYRSVQPTIVFNRELKEGHTVISFNPAVEKLSDVELNELQVKCLNNMSIIAASQQVNIPFTVLDEVRNWMRNAIMPLILPQREMYAWSVEEMRDNPDVKKHILDFLHHSDFNISNLQSREQKHRIELPQPALNAFVYALFEANGVDEEKANILRVSIDQDAKKHRLDTQFTHRVVNDKGTEEYLLDENVESYGTRRIIGMEAAIYTATKEGAFLNIDELEASMHHDLVLYVLSKFLCQQSESQMLVTTHCTSLLAWIDKLIRKDSVWFTERAKDGNSSLYTLVEFKGLNRLSSIQNAYLAGKFGAIPEIIINNNDHLGTHK